MKILALTISILFFVLPEIAFAEVSDKVPSIIRLWIVGVSVGILGFFSARYRIWTGLVAGLVSLLFCIVHYGVISDPFVGPAIMKEQGNPYIFSVYGSIVLMIVPLVAGFLFKLFKHKKAT